LNGPLQAQLREQIEALAEDRSIRAIILTGEGDRAFIAGADISEFVGASPAKALELASLTKQVTDAIVVCPKPVIAVINGFCLGGGLEVALACDIRIASRNAKLGLPEIKLGIIPGGGGTVRLTKIAGGAVARMMAMTGEPISADQALMFGLLAAVHEPEDLREAGRALASKLAALAPFAMAQLKASLNTAVDVETDAACHAEMRSFALCFSTRDQAEGVSAFLDKRRPEFTGE
jgi:enoyl-CoA hydratase